jgi:flagellar hook-basal body complex protein FliE
VAAAAAYRAASSASDGGSQATGFGGLVQRALEQGVEIGRSAEAASTAAMLGQGGVTEAVLAISKAELTLQTAVAVRDRVVALIAENPAALAVHRALLGDWRRIILVTALLRVSPLPSFAVVNFILASARTPLGGCTVGTVIGLIPRTAAAAFVAAGIEKLHAENLTETPLWVSIGGLVAFVVTSLAIGVLARRALTRVSRR